MFKNSNPFPFRMAKTLVAELGTVDKVVDNAGIDKINAYRSILEKWAESNTLVKMATEGKMNVSDEYRFISQELFGYGKNYYPSFVDKEGQTIYVNRQGQKIKISEMEAVVGDFVGNNTINIVYNPAGLAAAVGILACIVGRVFYKWIHPLMIEEDDEKSDEDKQIDRRKFLRLSAGAFAGVGSLIGLTISTQRRDQQINAKSNAIYVQSIISQVYDI